MSAYINTCIHNKAGWWWGWEGEGKGNFVNFSKKNLDGFFTLIVNQIYNLELVTWLPKRNLSTT